MQYSITFRHMEPSENLKQYGYEKLLRLEKYIDAVIDAEVVLTVEKFRHKAEVLVTSDGLKIKAEEETEDMYSAIDLVVDKIEKQVKRFREKQKDHKGAQARRGPRSGEEDFGAVDFGGEYAAPLVDREWSLTPPTLALKEAVHQLGATAQSQLIFVNEATGKLSIVRQNNQGLLELLTIDM